MQKDDPYEPPRAALADPAEDAVGRQFLASRLDRFWAWLLDLLLRLPLHTALVLAISAFDEGLAEDDLVLLAVLSPIGLGVLALQLVLLHSGGWTVGKRLLKIRIVRSDGSRAGLARIFWLRMLPLELIVWIPVVSLLGLVTDALFIFRGDRRCLHDWLAGTKVVNARPAKARVRLARARTAEVGAVS